MSSNWAFNLDMLAANGIIDFDAPSYLLDQTPRYSGGLQPEMLPMTNIGLLPEGTKLKDLPQADEYNNSNKKVVQNPKWKKYLFGTLAAVGIGGGVLAFLVSKGKIKMPKLAGLKNAGQTVLNYVKKPFQWIAGKFKKP